ncbi:bifunctional hydroxymethylpyrimidine kinase/phosphomethylpyrimidine kinase [Enterovibrio sp. ZSDZ42]|uniref:hydroxymethylpyrimidine kinase n=1 Tax=Enterovibrio gelatinilyticus TaxID=2899819 RepID=A0ABT5QW07_9GAMM|nr:bifunctional hydroxymethylpyrimidine kinase/phosphomethylpyrimidine kinase [Enterovibrio sp. ZSDZ42]MDD1792197.1 bifunctional hydroxymethylpyrimidine kinase/phosphomethylpyrimidine kinase [Enterovibrio sp. ZSDZ42]
MTSIPTSPPVILTIAGSDSSAGAGIQADLKTISANNGYACTVITAVTSQNTQGVYDVFSLPPPLVASQINAIFSDFNVAAVKVGMLANIEITRVVVEQLLAHKAKNIVVDPVMLSTSGRELLSHEAVSYCKEHLYPISTVLTPNLPELEALTELTGTKSLTKTTQKARQQLGCEWLLIKGGHSDDPTHSTDYLIGADSARSFSSPRIQSRNTHGTGCTLSSAIATFLAQGHSVEASVDKAKQYLSNAIVNARHQKLGKGHGPLGHFYCLKSR